MKLAQHTPGLRAGIEAAKRLPPATNLTFARWAAEAPLYRDDVRTEMHESYERHQRGIAHRNAENRRRKKLARKSLRGHRKPTRSHVEFINDLLDS
jgi:hypothetical protein